MAANAVLQSRAIHIFHRYECAPALFTNVVDRTYVRMVQRRRGFRFPAKSFERLPVMCQLFRQEFQSDEAVQSCVFGFVDDSHAPATDLLSDSVVRNDLTDKRIAARHVPSC